MCDIFVKNRHLLFHDGRPYYIETSPLICRANQWTDFYMIGNSIMNVFMSYVCVYESDLAQNI